MNSFVYFISQYGLITFFVLIIIDYACFPLSNGALLPCSGAIASLFNTPYLITLSVSVVASLFCTSIYYIIGRIGGYKLLNAIKRRFPKSRAKIDKALCDFRSHGAFSVFLARLLPVCRTYIGFVAGAAKLSFVTFITSSSIGISLWNSILIGIGYLFHDLWDSLSILFDQYKNNIVCFIVLAIFMLIILIYLLTSRKTPK